MHVNNGCCMEQSCSFNLCWTRFFAAEQRCTGSAGKAYGVHDKPWKTMQEHSGPFAGEGTHYERVKAFANFKLKNW
jgi:hypothetical protein